MKKIDFRACVLTLSLILVLALPWVPDAEAQPFGVLPIQGQIFASGDAGPAPITSCLEGFTYPHMYMVFQTTAAETISGTGDIRGMPRFDTLLAALGYSVEDVGVRLADSTFDPANYQWDPLTLTEIRQYVGGTWVISVAGVDLIGGPMPVLTVKIRYNTSSCFDDTIWGFTAYVLRTDMDLLVARSSPRDFKQLARALWRDIGNNGGLRLFFRTFQPAVSPGAFYVGVPEMPAYIVVNRNAGS